MINGFVIGSFGGHCDLFNYTGMLVAVSTTSGVGVTSIYAMEGGPAAMPEVDDISTQSGGKAGIWQGGMGLATDGGSRFFFATGKICFVPAPPQELDATLSLNFRQRPGSCKRRHPCIWTCQTHHSG